MMNPRQSTLTFIGPKPESVSSSCVLYDPCDTVTIQEG